MGLIIIILGALQILSGIMAYGAAVSAIHQILGAVLFGMGVLSVAIGSALQQLQAIRAATERHADAMEVLKNRRQGPAA